MGGDGWDLLSSQAKIRAKSCNTPRRLSLRQLVANVFFIFYVATCSLDYRFVMLMLLLFVLLPVRCVVCILCCSFFMCHSPLCKLKWRAPALLLLVVISYLSLIAILLRQVVTPSVCVSCCSTVNKSSVCLKRSTPHKSPINRLTTPGLNWSG